MGRLTLGLGLGVGYVLGARAGRARYEQIKTAAAGFMERPEVQQTLEKARTSAPAPLQAGIDKLSGRSSGGQGSGSGTGTATGTDSGTGTADVLAPPPPVADPGGPVLPDGPLPDPLLPPAKSPDRPT